jgi:hypothetical protein
MPRQIVSVRCTHVLVQVSVGFYDQEGNLVGEETFPQSDGAVIAAKLFHPHGEQLVSLINSCIEQALARLNTESPNIVDRTGPDGDRGEPGGT